MEGGVDILVLTEWLHKRTWLHVHTLCLSYPHPAYSRSREPSENFRDRLCQSNTNTCAHIHTHSLMSPLRHSYPLAFTVSRSKSVQPSHHSLYLLPCLNLPCVHLDISTSGCINESLSGWEKQSKRKLWPFHSRGDPEVYLRHSFTEQVLLHTTALTRHIKSFP